MTELIDMVRSWESLTAFGVALLVFGFAPGFFLRLIVRLYPKGDLRRDELVAELYGMPRVWRPMWVAQQLECGLFEGLGRRRAARREQRRHAWFDAMFKLLLLRWREQYDDLRVVEQVVTFSDEQGRIKVESRDHFPGARRRRPGRRNHEGDVGRTERP